MRPYTQTNVLQGNCWQTAIASLLEVDPASLPDQSLIESCVQGRYNNPLQGYLEKHHGLGYTEVQGCQTPGLTISPSHFDGHHLICGPTIRTPINGVHHCVVGRFGEEVWDVHPSRAGLVRVRAWGLLIPSTHWQLEDNGWKDRMREKDGRKSDMNCWCPSCGGVPDEWLAEHPLKVGENETLS